MKIDTDVDLNYINAIRSEVLAKFSKRLEGEMDVVPANMRYFFLWSSDYLALLKALEVKSKDAISPFVVGQETFFVAQNLRMPNGFRYFPFKITNLLMSNEALAHCFLCIVFGERAVFFINKGDGTLELE
jgi:hypothetical protein